MLASSPRRKSRTAHRLSLSSTCVRQLSTHPIPEGASLTHRSEHISWHLCDVRILPRPYDLRIAESQTESAPAARKGVSSQRGRQDPRPRPQARPSRVPSAYATTQRRRNIQGTYTLPSCRIDHISQGPLRDAGPERKRCRVLHPTIALSAHNPLKKAER
jgi:hypothetical protein